ncbi:MAG TPA: carbohydrate ABC transporter permease [Polyangiaceae bacterium]|nr:carbohydrate ABC transporter permease [Polyangiaceae bacterium]
MKVLPRSRALVYAILIVVAVAVLLPFAFMLSTSFKPPREIYEVPFRFIPRQPTLANYKSALLEVNLARGTLNTVAIAVPSTLGGLLTASFAGFAFAKLRFPGREALFAMLIATMMVPGVLLLIPQFSAFAEIGWVDTFWPLIVPGAMGTAMATFMMRQFFKGVPDEIIDAAALDGATPFYLFTRIVFPLARPALITLAVFGFKGAWNDYFGPLVYLSSPDKMNIQQMIAATQNAYGGDPGILMAGSALAMVPLLVMFLFAQRYFIEGIATTGLK